MFKFFQFQIGMIGLAYLGTGIIGGFIGTIYLEFYSKNEVYDPLIKVFILLGFGSLVNSLDFTLFEVKL